MLDRLKRALVSSYVGAIALGWLFSQAILHFAYVFSAPVANWAARREYHGLMDRAAMPTGISLHDSIPELAKFVSLLLIGYVLLRWLYYKPIEPTQLCSEQSAQVET